MIHTLKYSFPTLLLLIFSFENVCFSQDNNLIDSLEKVLLSVKDDTAKVFVLRDLAFELRFVNPEASIGRAQEAVKLSKVLHFNLGEAISLNNLGLAFNAFGDYKKAIDCHNQSILLFEKINDRIGIAKAKHNIGYAYSIIGEIDSTLKYYLISLEIAKASGNYSLANATYSKISNVYMNTGNFVKAMEYSEKALKSCEKENDAPGQAETLNNIGNILKSQKKYDAALEYFFKSLAIGEKISDKSYCATAMNNIGTVYDKKNKPDEALKYYLQSIKIKEDAGNLRTIVVTYSNIAILYKDKGDFPKAIEYNNKALAIDKRLDDKYGICCDYLNLAEIESQKKNLPKAKEYLENSLEIAEKSGFKELLENIYGGFTQLYDKLENYKLAYHYQRLHSEMRDSILNGESSKQITEMQTKYETEKKELQIENLHKDNAIKETEIKKQNFQKLAFASGFIFMLILAFVILRGYNQKKKANEIISAQKTEVEKQKEIVDEKNSSLEIAYKHIEEKNTEILDSIKYAKRIQEAILPPQKLVKQQLEQSFILYKPKDIVAGDFYWMETSPGKVLFASVDCTGHGVPGAFMSILGFNGLNRCVKEFGLIKPAAILDKLCELVDEAFSKSEADIKDGMDIALCCYDYTKKTLEYSGAGNSLYHIRKKCLTEIKADKQPVGKFAYRKAFTNHLIQLEAADSFYVFTDGYADQFGGPKGKKFKYKQFENLLISLQDKSMAEQREFLNSTIEKWRGELEQIDDICIIGVQV